MLGERDAELRIFSDLICPFKAAPSHIRVTIAFLIRTGSINAMEPMNMKRLVCLPTSLRASARMEGN